MMGKRALRKKKIRALHLIKEKVNPLLPGSNSRPIFLLGCQRSGTTMLMDVFELNFNSLVYNESDTKAFDGTFRIIGFEHLGGIVDSSNFEFTVFKPIVDSHRIDEFVHNFPDCKILWMYRDYRDMVNSSVVKWGMEKDNSIRILGRGEELTDWFAEGLSDNTVRVIRQLYRTEFSNHDCAALWWWSRNQIVTEKKIYNRKNVLLVNYDNLVREPDRELADISRFLGAKKELSPKGYIHAQSIRRREFPDIDSDVRELCESLAGELDEIMATTKMNMDSPHGQTA